MSSNVKGIKADLTGKAKLISFFCTERKKNELRDEKKQKGGSLYQRLMIIIEVIEQLKCYTTLAGQCFKDFFPPPSTRSYILVVRRYVAKY